MEKYLFKKPLIEGLIKSRPNRFIMIVEINGKTEKCHCPSTGQIASITFNDIPCLVSESDNENRKTNFTVGAISLDSKEEQNKSWIGINQTKTNDYVDFFLKSNQLKKIFPKVKKIKREVKLNNSRIDFLVNEKDFLEVKTLLKNIPSEDHPNYKKRDSKFISFDRLIKHFEDISKSITKDSRAIFLLCHTYDAKPFAPSKDSSSKIIKTVKNAVSKGVEQWQTNLKVDNLGVELINHFKLDLFN